MNRCQEKQQRWVTRDVVHTTREVFTIVVEITLHLCLSSISVRTGALHAVMYWRRKSNGDISMQMARVYAKQYGTGCGT